MNHKNVRPPEFAAAVRAAGFRALTLCALAALGAGCADEAGGPADDTAAEEAESICGPTDDAQLVNDYDGTLGPSVSFVQNNKSFVGALERTAAANSSKYCSGTLISADLFLTAGHCVNGPQTGPAVGQFVAFNFERAEGGGALLPQSHFRIAEVVEDERGGLDYAILRLEGNPGDTFGFAPVRTTDPSAGSAITIIGHPEGEPKQIEAGSVASVSGSFIRYGNVDTRGGNSGSSILDAQGRVGGVHTLGGCGVNGGTNAGVRISRIRSVSNVL